jgi:hypothetical protein
MVTRKFNRPLCHVRSSPLFWLHRVGVEWSCRKCGARTKDSVSFEVHHKLSSGSGGQGTVLKSFLCLSCAEQLLEEALSKVKLCRSKGPDGYDMMMSI